MRIYAYLRASTEEQCALRAQEQLAAFAEQHQASVASWFTENESGATLKRPELFRLLDVAQTGDILLIEQVDRLSRLNAQDWDTLKAIIHEKGIRIVALDLPTSHQFMKNNGDIFTDRILDALNGMMLDMLAAVARKDYEANRARQAQGIQKAKSLGKYKGKPINKALHQKITVMLLEGKTYNYIVKMLGCSRHTIASAKKNLDAQQNKELRVCSYS
ncbi:MAG: recombinase family protein [Alteromonadaceae bacterium]|nr:recombinase family protein [Alteromonadaceae bacterium]